MNSTILECRDVVVSYGAFRAVNSVSLKIKKGKIYSIIGPNGAGKTTLINAISGLQKPNSGQVRFNNENITRLDPHSRSKKGMGRSFQIINIFPFMTVFENLRLAGQAEQFRLQPLWRSVMGYKKLSQAAHEMAAFIGLKDQEDTKAALLSHGSQRSLELGISLMTNPDLLLLDEPMAGVGHHEFRNTVDLIEKAAENRTVILIEHNMDIVLSISDQIIVLVGGKVLCVGSPEEIQANPKVKEVYLGEEKEEYAVA